MPAISELLTCSEATLSLLVSGGIYSLKQLMGTHSQQYHVPGMELLCSYVRAPPSDTSLSNEILTKALREDVQAAMNVVGSRDQKSIAIEEKAKFKIHLEGVDLSYIRLQNANLSSARFEGANFSNAVLKGVNMSYTIFNEAIFTDISISSDSDLSVSSFQDAKFYRCRLSECKLVDARLNCAIMDWSNVRCSRLFGCATSEYRPYRLPISANSAREI